MEDSILNKLIKKVLNENIEIKYDENKDKIVIDMKDLNSSMHIENLEGQKILFTIVENTNKFNYNIDKWTEVKSSLDDVMIYMEKQINQKYCKHKKLIYENRFYTDLFRMVLKEENLPKGYKLKLNECAGLYEIEILEEKTNTTFSTMFCQENCYEESFNNLLSSFKLFIGVEDKDDIKKENIGRIIVQIPAYELSEYSLINTIYVSNMKKPTPQNAQDWIKSIINKENKIKTKMDNFLHNVLLDCHLLNNEKKVTEKKNKI